LGARVTPYDELVKIVRAWFAAKFDHGRHERRVNKIREIEQEELAHQVAVKN
jgi:ribose 5-phosphate isomerase RpiB